MLELQDIHFSHAGCPGTLIHGVSLAVAEGEIGCLLGPSGCGKTTLLRLISGFERPSKGTITIHGRMVVGNGMCLQPEQRRVGVVFQEYALFPHLTVAGNVGFGLSGRARVDKADRVSNLLRKVGLEKEAHRFPHEISGGQQQRVAIARAMVMEPEVLLLDEPFSNLDRDLSERLRLEVKDLLKTLGVTAVLITHNQEEAFDIADRVGVLHDGRIQQWGTPNDLYFRPQNSYVAEFIGDGSFAFPWELASFDLAVNRGLGFAKDSFSQVQRLFIRPDNVWIDPQSPLRGTVVSKRFRGMYGLFHVRLESGSILKVFSPNPQGYPVGEEVGICANLDSCPLF